MTRSARLGAFIAAAVVLFFFAGLSGWLESEVFQWIDLSTLNPHLSRIALFFGILNFNLILLAICLFLVLRSAVQLAVERKKGVFGSSLRTKLLTSFVSFALLPTVILLFMTSRFVDANFDRWLPSGLVDVSRQSAAAEQQSKEMILRTLDYLRESDLKDNRMLGLVDFTFDSETDDFLLRPAMSQELQLDTKQAEWNDVLRKQVGKWAERSLGSQARWIHPDEGPPFAIRRLGEKTWVGLIGTAPLHLHWQTLERDFGSSEAGVELLRVSYYVMVGVLVLLILFAATWLGFTIAREFSGPLLALAQAAERVARGDYSVEIDEFVSDDEMGQLAQSFRLMVSDLRSGTEKAKLSSEELSLKAQQLERNSEYNELLLRHVNSGVLVIDGLGQITAWNNQTERILGLPASLAIGKRAEEVLDRDFYRTVFKEPDLRQDVVIDGRLPTDRMGVKIGFRGVLEGRERNLQITLVSLDPREAGAQRPDILVLIEDLTDLARAQRIAAWRDVARRVAHEIKNPLTPITLGIARIEKRFADRLEGQERKVLDECVRTIQDSAASIRRLVEEFLNFARMPEANLRSGDLIETVRLAVTSFTGHDGLPVPFRVLLQEGPERQSRELVGGELLSFSEKHVATFDRDQIVRLVSNLLANALAACEDTAAPVRLELVLMPQLATCHLRVIDEGPGIPRELRAKIFEPYFSTRRRGSGLGLPIVRQIVAEHRGEILVLDNKPRGTEFKIRLPILAKVDLVSVTQGDSDDE